MIKSVPAWERDSGWSWARQSWILRRRRTGPASRGSPSAGRTSGDKIYKMYMVCIFEGWYRLTQLVGGEIWWTIFCLFVVQLLNSCPKASYQKITIHNQMGSGYTEPKWLSRRFCEMVSLSSTDTLHYPYHQGKLQVTHRNFPTKPILKLNKSVCKWLTVPVRRWTFPGRGRPTRLPGRWRRTSATSSAGSARRGGPAQHRCRTPRWTRSEVEGRTS